MFTKIMKKLFTNKSFLFLTTVIFAACIFNACQKETSNTSAQKGVLESTASESLGVYEIDCNRKTVKFKDLADISYAGDTVLGNFTNLSGELNKFVLGCPSKANADCKPTEIIERDGSGRRISYFLEEGCSVGVPPPFSILNQLRTPAQQDALIAKAKQLAVQNAPFCSGTTRRMTPIAYDFYIENMSCLCDATHKNISLLVSVRYGCCVNND